MISCTFLEHGPSVYPIANGLGDGAWDRERGGSGGFGVKAEVLDFHGLGSFSVVEMCPTWFPFTS